MDLARSHFRMGCAAELASHLAHYFGGSDFEHRGQSAPDLAKKSVSVGFLDRLQLDPSSSFLEEIELRVFRYLREKCDLKLPPSPKCAKVGFLDKILGVLVMLDNPAHCISRSG